MSTKSPIPIWQRALGIIAALFGALTLFKGGSVIFGPDSARDAVGNFVPFVVWFNFLAGFAYLVGAYAIWSGQSWARPLAFAIALATLAVGAAFAIHAMAGGAFSMQTVGALPLRVGFWLFIGIMLGKSSK